MRKKSIFLFFLSLVLIFLIFSIKIGLGQNSTQWDITYQIHGSGRCVIETKDGGYAIAGNDDNQFLLIKLDSLGNIQWQKTYGEGTAYSLVETNDNGYALAGTGIDFNFIKTDSQGNLEWIKHYNQSGTPFHAQSVIQTSDGGFALAGWISNVFSSPVWDWTIKTDSNGNVQWNRTFGIRSGISHAQEIIEETEGGYALAANGNVSKLDPEGNIRWTTNAVVANDLVKTADGGYLVAAGNGGTLIKLDSEGNVEWSSSYKFEGAQWSFFNSAVQSSYGGYIIVEVTYPVYNGLGWVLKVDENGNVEGEVTFPPETGINNRINSLIETKDGDYVFTGSKNANNGQGSIWLTKITLSSIPEFPSWTPFLISGLITTFVMSIIYRQRMIRKGENEEK